MSDPVAALEQWCDNHSTSIQGENKHDSIRGFRAQEQRVVQAYRAIIARYREEQSWGDIGKQLHACGGNRESARMAANRAMYTADGLFIAIKHLAAAHTQEEQ